MSASRRDGRRGNGGVQVAIPGRGGGDLQVEVRSSEFVMEALEGRAGTHSCREERDEVDGSRADRTVLHAEGRDAESRDSTSVASLK